MSSSNEGDGDAAGENEEIITVPSWRPKQDGKLFRIIFDYIEQPGDAKLTAEKKKLEDGRGFYVEIKIIRKQPDVLRIRSRVIPMEEFHSFKITNPEDVNQNKEGKYIVEMICTDKKSKLAEHFRAPSPIS